MVLMFDDNRRAEPPRSPWELLGIPDTATLAEVKLAFRRRALATHPDHGGDPDEFRALYRAYERAIAKRG